MLLAGCGSKSSEPGGGGGGGSGSAAATPAQVTCPAGNVVKDGACVAVVTPEKVEVVVQQRTRIDELAALLDKVDTLAAPIELLDAFRKLDDWKQLTAKFDKLKMVDGVVAELGNAVKTLRTFKASLGEASGRLGNLKGELDRLLASSGAAPRIEEVRAQVSSQVRAALEPLAHQTSDTIQHALQPLTAKLEEVGAVIDTTCGVATLSGASASTKDLCKQAKAAFASGIAYLDDFKARPQQLFDQVSSQLEAQLGQLIDAEVQQVIDRAQQEVNQALGMPAGSNQP